MLLTELFDLDEAAGVGVVPPTKKAAKDPRYANALTVDIHPGETQKQAAKFGNKTDKLGRPPIMNPSGKVTEAAMSTTIQGRNPVSAGARGLMAARWKYDNIVGEAEGKNMSNAVARLASKVVELPQINYHSVDDLMQHIAQSFEVNVNNLHKAFVEKYHVIPDDYAKKIQHQKKNSPKAV